MTLFHENDIRGVFGKDLTFEFAQRIGKAFEVYTKSKDILIGRDVRESSPKLREAIISGISKPVIDIGQVTTPMFYFALDYYKKQAGIMITASHLPKQYNGIKLNDGNFRLTNEKGLSDILKLAEKELIIGYYKTSVFKTDIEKDYLKWITDKIQLRKRLRVGIDCGNGSVGPIAIKALKLVGCSLYKLYCKPDGKFPNHVPNPLINESLKELQNLVIKKQLDIGFGFDGDGDRIRVVSPSGEIIDNDVFARKKRGYLDEKLVLVDLEDRGQITRW